jgi:hypothetical protein
MKSLYQFIILINQMVLILSCKKEATTITPAIETINTLPQVNAGRDTTLILPVNTVLLSGMARDKETNIISYQWIKIQGPTKFTLSTPHLPETIVSDLERGTYIFELTVIDGTGLMAKDTVNIAVVKIPEIIISPSEIIFKDLEWGCFGQCYLAIEKIDSLLPPNKPIQVYIKRDSSSDWIPVIEDTPGIQTQYTYYFENYIGKTLWIVNYIEDGYDTPDLKILF